MKITKVFTFLIAVLFTTFPFVSCSDNDSDGSSEVVEEYRELLQEQQSFLDRADVDLANALNHMYYAESQYPSIKDKLSTLLSDYEETLKLVAELRANASDEHQEILNDIVLILTDFNKKISGISAQVSEIESELNIGLSDCQQLFTEVESLRQKIQRLPLFGEDERILVTFQQKVDDIVFTGTNITAFADATKKELETLSEILEEQKAILDTIR